MSQSVYQCYKRFSQNSQSKALPLLCSASISILWVMAIDNCAIAQKSPYFRRSGSGSQSPSLLKVPSSLPSLRSASQKVPPPPNTFSNTLQAAPIDNIKDLENRFIEQMTNRNSFSSKSATVSELKSKSKDRDLPIPATGQNNSILGFKELSFTDFRQQNGKLSECVNASNCREEKYKTRLSQLQGQNNLELSQFQNTQPTFNQLLYPKNSSESKQFRNSQTQEFVAPTTSSIPPLPPLPGETPTDTNLNSPPPTFNQLLNSRRFSKSPSKSFALPKITSFKGREQSIIQPFPNSSNTPSFSGIQPSPQKQPVVSNIGETVQSSPHSISQNQIPTAGISTKPVREPSLKFEGVYLTQGEDTSARARLTGIYPLSSQALFGATLDLTSENSSFDDSRGEGLNINELYFATSVSGVPNLRFAVGQLDLTSYFDRNSFAKDGASQFFNPVFQTNPALAATGISSRTGLLVNWSVADNVDAKAAIFSSSDKLSDFTLDGFAGEIGIRYGNAIIRGTYATSRDAGNRDTFPESFGIARGNGQFGPLEDDREEAYGVNAEVFIPKVNLGLFARYGRYENRDIGEGADTYVLGASFLDIFTPDDRLGLAYGRALSNDSLRNGDYPDVVELFYDFKFVPNLRLGFTIQGRDSFEETVLGIRVRSEFDIAPKRRGSQ